MELVDLSVCEVVTDIERVGAHCKWRARRRSMRYFLICEMDMEDGNHKLREKIEFVEIRDLRRGKGSSDRKYDQNPGAVKLDAFNLTNSCHRTYSVKKQTATCCGAWVFGVRSCKLTSSTLCGTYSTQTPSAREGRR